MAAFEAPTLIGSSNLRAPLNLRRRSLEYRSIMQGCCWAVRGPGAKVTLQAEPQDPVLLKGAAVASLLHPKCIVLVTAHKVTMAPAIGCLLGRRALPRVFVKTACLISYSIWLLCELQRAKLGVFSKLTLLYVAAAAPAYHCLDAVRSTLKLWTVVLATAYDQPAARSTTLLLFLVL